MKNFLLLILLILIHPVSAETILIKRGSGKKSKAILDKQFVFMQAGESEAFQKSDSGNTSTPSTPKTSSSLGSINSSLEKIKTAPTKIASLNTATIKPNQAVKPQVDIFDEGNWGDYAEYQDVEYDESLGVNAKLISQP